MSKKFKIFLLAPLTVGLFLAGARFATRYQSATNNKREMLAMTQSLLRLNRDETQRNPLARNKINELKEKRDFVSASRGERSDGLSRPCSSRGLFLINTEKLLIDYDNYLNSRNGIYTFYDKKSGKEIRPDEMFETFKSTEASASEWLKKSADRCAWGYGEGGVDSIGRKIKFFFF